MKFNLKKYSNISTKDYWDRDLNEILDGINYAHNKHKFSISLLQDMHSKRLLSGKFSDDDFKKAIEKINIGINSAFIRFILSNPNCPVNLLIEVIEEYGKKYINEIFNNPNFPIDLKIEYSKKLGLVTEEDKSIHILEERKEENKDLGKRENKDLENFRSLLGNSFNLKRYSQDRNILRNQDILRLPDSLGDNLSFIENQLNFTEDPDRIRVILDKYHNNYHYNNGTLFYFATENRNCPEDVIIKAFYVCKDHKFNMTKLGVIRHIVNSINTPPDILELVLDGDFSNSIQNIAALNPNCPPDSKIKHLKDSGEITREDKDKHILDTNLPNQTNQQEKIENNKDLENFRSLLGNSFSNSFNLKRYSQQAYRSPIEIALNSNNANELQDLIKISLDNYNANKDKNKEIILLALENQNLSFDSFRYILENPKCPLVILKSTAIELIWRSECPFDLLFSIANNAMLSNDINIADPIVHHRNSNGQIFDLILSNSFPENQYLNICNAIANNPNCTDEYIVKTLKNESPINYKFIKFILSSDKMNDSLFSYIFKEFSDTKHMPSLLSSEGYKTALQNKRCSQDSLRMEFNLLSQNADSNLPYITSIVKNKNCPPDILKQIIDNPRNSIIKSIANNNENCPPDSKIKYLKDMGRIEKEDPSKHILEDIKEDKHEKREKGEDKHENNDLDNFRNLLSNSFNLKRYSQDEKFSKLLKDPYNIAKNSSDPNELRKVIQNNSSERFVIFTAVINKHCPLDALISLWSSDKYQLDKQVNYAIANRLVNNTECPSEVLDSIIFNVYMGNEDIKLRVAQHRNCNDILISNILLRSHYSTVVTEALKNKNCTNEAIKYALENMDPHDKGYIIEAIADFVSDAEVIVSALDIFRSTSTPSYNYFLENKNCNAEILRKEYFLIGGQKTRLSSLRAIVENNNCPSDVIGLILQNNLLHDDGDVKLKALQNPNCSEDAKINFYKKTGRIITEDKEKHILDDSNENALQGNAPQGNAPQGNKALNKENDIDKFRSLLND